MHTKHKVLFLSLIGAILSLTLIVSVVKSLQTEKNTQLTQGVTAADNVNASTKKNPEKNRNDYKVNAVKVLLEIDKNYNNEKIVVGEQDEQ